MPAEQHGFSIIQAFLNFSDLGAEWVMWLMVALGFMMIAICVERLRLYVTTRIDAPSLARGLVESLDAGDVAKAKALVSAGRAMEERVVADAVEALPRGVFAVEQLMASSLARERMRYDRFLSILGTVGNNAPFVGLFGTVIGIILAFKQLGANPKGGLEVVGPAIAEALVATAVGLLVAIPSVAAYNSFKASLKERVNNTEFLSRIVLASAHRREGSK
jgi:biopolymer transport protein ExbB/TolQ